MASNIHFVNTRRFASPSVTTPPAQSRTRTKIFPWEEEGTDPVIAGPSSPVGSSQAFKLKALGGSESSTLLSPQSALSSHAEASPLAGKTRARDVEAFPLPGKTRAVRTRVPEMAVNKITDDREGKKKEIRIAKGFFFSM